MIQLRAAAVAIAAGLALVACQPAAKAPATPEGGLAIAPLEYKFRELANGLRVYAMPDADTASVSVAVWYDVGSKDDPGGRSGFAHLFEHMMFKSTTNMPAETFDRLTEDVGGFNNASTWNDFTNYYETVPANHLERVLWGEAERMGSLVIDDANFRSERDVVKEELRQSVLSQPYGKLFYLYLTQSAFNVHPYGRPGIGSLADLDAATVEDVRAFHAAYYRPDNAVLVVSGNFDQAQLDAWVDKYFAGIKKPDRPIPRVTAVEPARTEAKDLTVYEPNVPLPAVLMSWSQPEAESPDIPALMLIDAIMTRGQSSRLYQSMVYTQKLAADVGSNFDINDQPGVYALYAILSDGKTAAEGVASLKAEVAKMRDAPVSPEELEEARNELITSALQNRETSDGRADELARSVILYRDPQASDKILAQLQTVTAEDIQRVAKAILDDRKTITIRYLPEEQQNGAPETTFVDAPTIQATKIDIPAAEIPTYSLAAEASRAQPPAAGPAVAAKVPGATEKTLANGLRVIVANKPGLPLVSASLRISAGSALDPKDKAGLATMTADLTTRGTETRSATEIARQIETLGAAISASAGPDATDVSVGGRADKAADMFAIMADVVQHPAFAQEELDRARQETLDGLMVQLRQPSSIGRFAMNRALFGDAPYGGTPTPKSIEALAQTDIAAFHDAWWRPDNAILVIAGDITPEAGFALAEGALGQWAKPEAALGAAPSPAGAAQAPASIAIDVPQIGQAAVLLGRTGPARTDADYFPTLVANNVLGGGYSARLNAEIRIKRGLSYGASSGVASRKAAAPIIASAQTRNDAVPQVVDLMLSEFTRLGSAPIPASELDARKAVLIGGFGRSVETTGGLAGQLSALAQFGLPLDKLQSYSADVGAVTAEQAGAAAKAYYDPAKASLIVVGDAKQFWSGVRAKREGFERIGIDKLNLDSATLK
ncbi:MAG TPA: pitrilysin family protein [Hyphomonadaceae bacterium]|nr:pitrilysin family protein [Hyphomonadaceae bacterium]